MGNDWLLAEVESLLSEAGKIRGERDIATQEAFVGAVLQILHRSGHWDEAELQGWQKRLQNETHSSRFGFALGWLRQLHREVGQARPLKARPAEASGTRRLATGEVGHRVDPKTPSTRAGLLGEVNEVLSMAERPAADKAEVNARSLVIVREVFGERSAEHRNLEGMCGREYAPDYGFPFGVGLLRAAKSRLVADVPDSGAYDGAARKVFVVHGRDYAAAQELGNLIRNQWPALEVVLLAEKAWKGKTIIEKFEREASQCGFAFAVLTPDDNVATPEGQYQQMRPNVVFELGWFYGRLGRDRTCVVYKRGTAIPSDLAGLGRCEYTDAVGEARADIERELKAAYGDDVA